MGGTGLIHTELIPVQMLAQRPAHILLRAVEHSLQDAGVGTTDRFVFIRLQAELAQPLDVLKGGKHVVKVSLHAAELKGAAVEGVVQIQHPGLAVLGLRVAFQHTVLLDQQPVGSLLLAGQAAPDPVQELFSSVKRANCSISINFRLMGATWVPLCGLMSTMRPD